MRNHRDPRTTSSVRRAALCALVAVAAVLGAACGAKDDSAPTTTARRTTTTAARQTTTSTMPPAPTSEPAAGGATLRVLVTNDDGVHAPGISVLVDALAALPNTQVTVVAPAENRSGTGGKVTDGSVSTSGTTTLSGYPATAVDGFPADAVAVALGENGPQPDVVVSGVNDGANLGPVTAISGTVGAARAGAEAGIPSLAVSQGKGDPPDFANGARLAVLWVEQHRASLLAHDIDVVGVVNLNVPTCTNGTVHGVKEVAPADNVAGTDAAPNCSAATESVDPTTDVQAYLNGWASQSELPLDG